MPTEAFVNTKTPVMTSADKIKREIDDFRQWMRDTIPSGIERFWTPYAMFEWLDQQTHPIDDPEIIRTFLALVIAEWRRSGSAAQLHMGADALMEKLFKKNRQYGDAALRPVNVFSHANAVQQMAAAVDYKLSRWLRGNAAGKDTIGDLAGYLVLLLIAMRDEAERADQTKAAGAQP